MAHAAREAQCFAVLYLDNDRFKEINDTWGHAVGDKVLKTVAARIRHQLRAGDMAARLGGDEFAVLLAPLNDLAEAQRIAGRIIQSVGG